MTGREQPHWQLLGRCPSHLRTRGQRRHGSRQRAPVLFGLHHIVLDLCDEQYQTNSQVTKHQLLPENSLRVLVSVLTCSARSLSSDSDTHLHEEFLFRDVSIPHQLHVISNGRDVIFRVGLSIAQTRLHPSTMTVQSFVDLFSAQAHAPHFITRISDCPGENVHVGSNV